MHEWFCVIHPGPGQLRVHFYIFARRLYEQPVNGYQERYTEYGPYNGDYDDCRHWKSLLLLSSAWHIVIALLFSIVSVNCIIGVVNDRASICVVGAVGVISVVGVVGRGNRDVQLNEPISILPINEARCIHIILSGAPLTLNCIQPSLVGGYIQNPVKLIHFDRCGDLLYGACCLNLNWHISVQIQHPD